MDDWPPTSYGDSFSLFDSVMSTGVNANFLTSEAYELFARGIYLRKPNITWDDTSKYPSLSKIARLLVPG